MIEREQRRRSFLLTMAYLGLGQALIPRRAAAQRAASQGYVLGRNEGEHLGQKETSGAFHEDGI